MPKLSTYVQEAAKQQQWVSTQPGAQHGTPGRAVAGAGAPAAPQPASPPCAAPSSNAGSSGSSSSELSLENHAAGLKLKEEYEKRLREHGTRLFRWPDGSLRPDKPPPSPAAAANRMKWQQLVQHCRTHGGDRSYEQQGRSLRYGINVSAADHAAYLQQAELEPELEVDGQHQGHIAAAAAAAEPLADPSHCFNTFYKEGAAQVFSRSRGRLL